MSQDVEQLFQAALELSDEEQLQLVSAVDERGLYPLRRFPGWRRPDGDRPNMTRLGSSRSRGRRSRSVPIEGHSGMAEIAFLPAAEADYRQALDWYRGHGDQSAVGFEAAVEVGLRAIGKAPEPWTASDERYRSTPCDLRRKSR